MRVKSKVEEGEVDAEVATAIVTELDAALRAHAKSDVDTEFLQKYHGRSRPALGLKNDQTRAVAKSARKNHPKIAIATWLAVLDALYSGETYEHRLVAGMILDDNKPVRQTVPLARFRGWVADLVGWAEIDGTCQRTWSGDDMLARWDEWQPFLESAATDDNRSLRRASLVLLCRPVRNSVDARLSAQAFANIDRLQHERDGLITKAVSWLLRELITNHAAAVEAYLNTNQSTLPAIALRETRTKLATGKKSGKHKS